ncbi:cholinephosphotransferase 1 isoform X1 [Centrocercus urophasianus]|uniref:cholinephosphotransferase 1 isoform X1 n=1 Tax=Centrocercus urophasianus TaxID=9002 RepID=UPI001C64F628|nr:cholinephosphotransferase 1 isoform X1 [Centrocercus urophasianus]
MAAPWVLPAPLSPAQLKRLEQHRYSAAGRSLLEPWLQPYWGWLVERLPLWLAPNAITLGGLLLNCLTALPLIASCPTATEQAPSWAYILGALGLFIYQSLDAIDGKQARRTNSSSPLGELFDHGCDSISTVFVVLGSCIAIRLGTNPDWLFFCCFVGLFMFYSAHWQTYVSGTLRFGKVDVTEVQIAITVLLLVSAFCGTAIWDYKVHLIGLELKFFAVVGILCGTAVSCFNYFRVIVGGGVGKNGSTIAGTSVLSPGVHIGLLVTLAIVIYKKSTIQLFEKHPCLYVLTFGFVNAKISQKLVVAHMTKSEISLQDTAFIGPGLLFLDQYFNSVIDEYVVLWIALFISLFDMLRYATGVCLQIAAHLHIHVFRISSHQAPEQVQVVSPLSRQNNMD